MNASETLGFRGHQRAAGYLINARSRRPLGCGGCDVGAPNELTDGIYGTGVGYLPSGSDPNPARHRPSGLRCPDYGVKGRHFEKTNIEAEMTVEV